jgi:hypothetical protein
MLSLSGLDVVFLLFLQLLLKTFLATMAELIEEAFGAAALVFIEFLVFFGPILAISL